MLQLMLNRILTRNLLLYISCLLIPGLGCTVGYAQTSLELPYNVTRFTDADGLPQNSIKSIVPDKRGFIWLATEKGLTRFDGSRFNVYKSDTGQSISARIQYFLPSGEQENYWALTGNGNSRIRKYIQVNESMAVVPDTASQRNIFTKLFSTNPEIFTAIGLPNVYVNDLARYYCVPFSNSSYALISKDSVHIQQQQSWSVVFPNADIQHFFTAGSQLYYWGRKNEPVVFRSGGIKTVTLEGDILRNPLYAANKPTVSIYWNICTGQLFFGLRGTLYKADALANGNLHTEMILEGFDPEYYKIISMYYNEALGKVFMGSLVTGLYIGSKNSFTVLRNGESARYYAQAAWGNGNVLTPGGYVTGLYSKAITLPAISSKGFNDYYSMLIARDSSIWIKSSQSLYRFNYSGTKVTGEWSLKQDITQIYEDSRRNIWIGMKGEMGGLYHLRYGAAEPELILENIGDVAYMQQLNDSLLLAGTGLGCYKIHITNFTVDTLKEVNGKYVRSIYVRSADEAWITTYNDGFFLYNNNRVVRLPFDRNRYLSGAHCILEDKKGFFWITTDKGLFQVARQDLLNYANSIQQNVFYCYYGQGSGLSSNEFNGGCEPCGIALTNGYFSFPSMEGLVWLQPSLLRPLLPNGELFIDRIEIDRATVAGTDTLQIPGEAQRIKISVATPYFGDAYNLDIEYALLSGASDTTWFLAGADKSITLSALSSGTHWLYIRKCNGFGNENYTYKKIVLVVPPFFYETWWFRLLVLLLVAFLAWLYSALRLKYVQRRNKALEILVNERTVELEQAMHSLKQSERGLRRQTRMQERLITAIAHDIKSPLKFMSAIAKRVADRLDKKQQQAEWEQTQLIADSGTKMVYSTENLLHYIRLQMQNRKVISEQVDVFELVAEKINIFQSIARTHKTEIINLVVPGTMISTCASLLGVVIHNLLDNAVKITINGQVMIACSQDNDSFTLSVTDTGAGMREELMSWCNEEADINGEQQTTVHNGVGLMIVKELLGNIHGRLHTARFEPRGTVMQVIIRNVPTY